MDKNYRSKGGKEEIRQKIAQFRGSNKDTKKHREETHPQKGQNEKGNEN